LRSVWGHCLHVPSGPIAKPCVKSQTQEESRGSNLYPVRQKPLPPLLLFYRLRLMTHPLAPRTKGEEHDIHALIVVGSAIIEQGRQFLEGVSTYDR
jgi:hypothetical protein